MNAVPQIILPMLRRLEPQLSLPAYERSLIDACEAFPPPFGTSEYGDVYREAASDPEWLAISLATNAEREGDGAQRLWSLAASTEDPEVAAQIKQHAIDESRHSKIYLKIVDLVFEGAFEEKFRTEMNILSPGYTHRMMPVAKAGSPFSHSITLDDLIQMNIAEIRTAIHHMLQRPMLRAFCPKASYAKVRHLQRSLLTDEVKHVAYTAKLIEACAPQVGANAILQLFKERLNDFNEVTRAELENRVFETT